MIATMSIPSWNKSAYETIASPSFQIVRGYIPSGKEGQPPIRYDSTFANIFYQISNESTTILRGIITNLEIYTKTRTIILR